MTTPLYEECPLCEGTGLMTDQTGSINCPACQIVRVVPVGLTHEQVKQLFQKLNSNEQA